MRILGIETSCDETAVCLIEAVGTFESGFQFSPLGNGLYSQAALHAPYGGVFPNLAKREHQKNLVPLLGQALSEAGELREVQHPTDALALIPLKEILVREEELFQQLMPFALRYAKPNVDAIAVTAGPGLEPALWVGINFAKALSALWNVPLVAVNHMEGHILASLVKTTEEANVYHFEPIALPLLSLLISGGHTELLLSHELMHYELLGRTRDDAAGEAFDKVARLLDLPYPGGPHVSLLAEHARKDDLPRGFALTRPMISDDSLDFSFSGIKTAVRKLAEEHAPLSEEVRKQIACEFEQAVADVLVRKTMRAVDMHGVRTIVVGGGVSANTHIRHEMQRALDEEGLPVRLLIPSPHLATDNALMIALAGYFRAQKGEFADPSTLRANGTLSLASA